MKKVITLLIATLLISCQTELGKFDEDKDLSMVSVMIMRQMRTDITLLHLNDN
jgi:hypothetical protein